MTVPPGPEHGQNALIVLLYTEQSLVVEYFSKIFGQSDEVFRDRLVFGFYRRPQHVLDTAIPRLYIPPIENELGIFPAIIDMVLFLAGVKVPEF